MKKKFLLLGSIMAVIGFVSCSSFSSKKVEGYWWHSWGADGYDYVCIHSNGMCDYDFGEARNKKGSIVIDDKNRTITILDNFDVVRTFVYDEEKDMLVQPGTSYDLWRMPEELNEEIYEIISNTTDNKWIYGTWKCKTPYGTVKLIITANGRIYDSIDEKWYSYTIEGNRIIEQCDGYISSYNIDRENKRFDAGKPGMWFYKISD